MNTGICEGCRYFSQDSATMGECRFSPPKMGSLEDFVDHMDAGFGYGVWPRVARDDWCKEWTLRLA